MTNSNRVVLGENAVHSDERGLHVKCFGKTSKPLPTPATFKVHEVFLTVNHKNVLRGMHFQVNPSQPKALTCVSGSVQAFVVDLSEPGSFNVYERRLYGLSPDTTVSDQVYVPENHALGYLALEDNTRMLYIVGSDFHSSGDVGIHPFDTDLGLEWDVNQGDVILSDRDKNLPSLDEYWSTLK